MQSCPELLGVFLGATMKFITDLAAVAANYSDNQAERLAFHVGMLEAHLRDHILLVEVLEQEVRQLNLELSKEQA
jgi:hypothetical protein